MTENFRLPYQVLNALNTNVSHEEEPMKVSLVLFCIALLLIPSLSQAVNVGGTYGRNWLDNSGNKEIVPNSSGLWDWGETPIGHLFIKGKLASIPDTGSTLIYPAFVTNSTLIIGNATLNAPEYDPRHLTEDQLSSPYLMEDPWAVAQEVGQPILIQNQPNY